MVTEDGGSNRFHNPKVVGSSPTAATMLFILTESVECPASPEMRGIDWRVLIGLGYNTDFAEVLWQER